MYIKEVKIENIRSISNFEMEFEKPAGWHVIIGDNGSGKSSLVKTIALGLIGQNQIGGLRQNWIKWLKKGQKNGGINLDINIQGNLNFKESVYPANHNLKVKLSLHSLEENVLLEESYDYGKKPIPIHEFKGFSCGFGPFRRFNGGNESWNEMFTNNSFSRLASFLSLFDESVALTQIEKWIKELDYEGLKFSQNSSNGDEDPRIVLNGLKILINDSGFLPNNSKIFGLDGAIEIMDGTGNIHEISDLSDGFRSILSLTFELIRQSLVYFSPSQVFGNMHSKQPHIPIKGVVLIDEIDAHLHPTWQTRIGQWFTKYFPNIQFIVTTHSPLICRAAENGTIWRLAAPGSNEESGEVTGIDRERLIYGNVLDAFGTEVFGKSVSISKSSNEKLKRMGELNIKSLLGDKMSKKEETELFDLKSVFPTERIQ